MDHKKNRILLTHSHQHGTFLNKDLPPMRLCKVCRGLSMSTLHHLSDKDRLPHQPSFLAIKSAASAGCELCTLVYQSLLSEYANHHKYSVKEAEHIFTSSSQSKHVNPQCFVKTKSTQSRTVEVDEIIFQIPNGAQGRLIAPGSEFTAVRFTIRAFSSRMTLPTELYAK